MGKLICYFRHFEEFFSILEANTKGDIAVEEEIEIPEFPHIDAQRASIFTGNSTAIGLTTDQVYKFELILSEDLLELIKYNAKVSIKCKSCGLPKVYFENNKHDIVVKDNQRINVYISTGPELSGKFENIIFAITIDKQTVVVVVSLLICVTKQEAENIKFSLADNSIRKWNEMVPFTPMILNDINNVELFSWTEKGKIATSVYFQPIGPDLTDREKLELMYYTTITPDKLVFMSPEDRRNYHTIFIKFEKRRVFDEINETPAEKLERERHIFADRYVAATEITYKLRLHKPIGKSIQYIHDCINGVEEEYNYIVINWDCEIVYTPKRENLKSLEVKQPLSKFKCVITRQV